MTRRTLVAGGAGFLGSHLCDRLIERGEHVICVDSLVTGRSAHVAHLEGHDRFRLVEHDIVEPGLDEIVDELWNGERPSTVMNLACPASPPDYLAMPIETLEVGSIGTRRLLELAHHAGARFFLASTSEVYGDPLEHPQTEQYWGNVNPIGLRSVYDESKRFAEALTMAYHRARGLDVRIVRIFNTYGPRMRSDDGRVVSNFITQALRGDPITVYGDGTQTRSFCYVDDEVTGLLALLDGPVTGPVNIGNPGEFTMLELASIVIELTGSTSTIEFGPLPSDDPKVRRPDITMARQALDWEPRIQLREGLERTVAWFASQRSTDQLSGTTPYVRGPAGQPASRD